MDRYFIFLKDGLDLGVAFDGLAGEIYPAVVFYNQGQQISLLPYSSCPGAVRTSRTPYEAKSWMRLN